MPFVTLTSPGGLAYLGPSAGHAVLHPDVTVKTGDGVIQANRAVLAASCSVLNRCLPRRMEDDAVQVLFPEHSCMEVGALLEVMYGRAEEVEMRLVEGLMRDIGFRWGKDEDVKGGGGGSLRAQFKAEKPVEYDEWYDEGDDNHRWAGHPGYDGEDWDDDNGEAPKMEPEVHVSVGKHGRRGWKKGKRRGRPPKRRSDDPDEDGDFVPGVKREPDDFDGGGGNDNSWEPPAAEEPGESSDESWNETDEDYVPERKRGRRSRDDYGGGGRFKREVNLYEDFASLSREPGAQTVRCPEKDCDFSDPDRTRMFHHLSSEHQLYVCQYCGALEGRLHHLRQHLEDYHQELPNQICKRCNALCTEDGYWYHLKDHATEFERDPDDPAGLYACPEEECKFKHGQRDGVLEHLTWRHNKRFCPICGLYFPIGDPLKKHFAQHKERLNYICSSCPRMFSTQGELKGHLRDDHGNVDMAPLEVLKEPDGKVKCPYEECPEVLETRFDVACHINKSHGTLTCPYCAKVMKGEDVSKNLVSHVKNFHTNKDKVMCPTCFHMFRTEKDLRFHSREAHGLEVDNYDICHQCGNSYLQGQVNQHLKRCSGKPDRKPRDNNVKPLRLDFDKTTNNKCPHEGCDFVTNKYGAMYRHYRVKHCRQLCPHCGKSYGWYNIKLHIALEHTKETHVMCDHCPERFYNKTLLKQHVERVHVNEPIHICDICGQGFYTSRERTTHRSEKHTRKKRQYPCPVCGRFFRSQTLVGPHILQAHPNLSEMANSSSC